MQQKQLVSIPIIIFLFSYTISLKSFAQLPSDKKNMTVVIDPGHGGMDPGAVGKGVREKDIVLSVGLKLGNLIKGNQPGVDVIFTRKDDTFIPLNKRADIANKSKADLFISIHANSCDVSSTTGAETFVLGLHRSQENLDVAKKENSVILLEKDYSTTYAGFDPNSSESYIMFELIQDEFLSQSVGLADRIQEQFKGISVRKDRGVKQAGFLVLRQSSMPAVLVELGFISNPTEAAYMSSEKGQYELAHSIYRAFVSYKKTFERKSDYHQITEPEPKLKTFELAKKDENSGPSAPQQTTPEKANTNKPDTAAQKAQEITPEKSGSSDVKTENFQKTPETPLIIQEQPKPVVSTTGNQTSAPAFNAQKPIAITSHSKQEPAPNAYFALQIAAGGSSIPPTPENFRGLQAVEMIKVGKFYKYYYGKEATVEAIIKLKPKVSAKFPGTFIVRIENGTVIPVKL